MILVLIDIICNLHYLKATHPEKALKLGNFVYFKPNAKSGHCLRLLDDKECYFILLRAAEMRLK